MAQGAQAKRRGVVAVIVRHGRLLVIERSQSVVAPGRYCFPGGAIEGSETEEEALRRELLEELGLAVTPVCCLWRSVTPWDVPLAWWRADIALEAKPVPNPAEVAACQWCTAAEMLALPRLLESNREFLAALAAGKFQLD